MPYPTRSLIGLDYPFIFPGTKLDPEKLSNLAIQNFSTLTLNQYPGNWYDFVFLWSDNVTKFTGNHAFKVGMSVERSGMKDQIQLSAASAPATTNQNGAFRFFDTTRTDGSGLAISNVLLGLFDDYTEFGNKPLTNFIGMGYDFYGQDSWRVTRQLTLELGLRYSLWQRRHRRRHRRAGRAHRPVHQGHRPHRAVADAAGAANHLRAQPHRQVASVDRWTSPTASSGPATRRRCTRSSTASSAAAETGVEVSVAGRLMLHRPSGKLAFSTLVDSSGPIQLFATVNDTARFDEFAKLSLGDWIGATGQVVKTRRASSASRSGTGCCWPRPAARSPTSGTA